MNELQDILTSLFEDRFQDTEYPDADTIVFGPESYCGLESMDTLRFMAALLPVYGDKVYDLRIEEFTTLRSVQLQLESA